MHYLLPQPKRQPTRRQAMKRCLLRAVFAKSFPSSQSALDLNKVFFWLHMSASVLGNCSINITSLNFFFLISCRKAESCGSRIEGWHWGRALQWICTLGEKIRQDFKTGEVSDGALCNDREHFALKGKEEREKKTGLFRSLLCGGPLIPLWRATKSYWYVGRRKENAEVWSPQRAVGRVLTMCCNDFTFKGDK